MIPRWGQAVLTRASGARVGVTGRKQSLRTSWWLLGRFTLRIAGRLRHIGIGIGIGRTLRRNLRPPARPGPQRPRHGRRHRPTPPRPDHRPPTRLPTHRQTQEGRRGGGCLPPTPVHRPATPQLAARLSVVDRHAAKFALSLRHQRWIAKRSGGHTSHEGGACCTRGRRVLVNGDARSANALSVPLMSPANTR